MQGRALAFSLLIVTASSASRADPQPKLLGPQEIMARMKASGSHYNVSTEALGSNPADVMWPMSDRWPESPVVVAEGPRNKVVARGCSADGHASITKVEADFQAKRYGVARTAYQALTQREPDCVRGWLYLGDSYFFEGNDKDALSAYEHAQALRPDDAPPYFFRGQTLARLGRRDEAVADFRKALSIHPHYSTLEALLSTGAKQLGVELQGGFAPRVLVKGAPPTIEVDMQNDLPGPDGVAWMAYGLCKALWIGDEAHRRDMTGQPTHAFTFIEEKECLVNLVAMAMTKGAKGPELVRLQAIAKAGLIDAFIVYELAARRQPTIALTLAPPQRALVERYVTEFVLTTPTP
jgi:tetratricopeptide (TPR) repeat protein